MERFTMNGRLWRVRFVDPDSPYLVDRTEDLSRDRPKAATCVCGARTARADAPKGPDPRIGPCCPGQL
nr:MAG TPA: hypothetical protein [Caudoviricetes sp.]